MLWCETNHHFVVTVRQCCYVVVLSAASARTRQIWHQAYKRVAFSRGNNWYNGVQGQKVGCTDEGWYVRTATWAYTNVLQRTLVCIQPICNAKGNIDGSMAATMTTISFLSFCNCRSCVIFHSMLYMNMMNCVQRSYYNSFFLYTHFFIFRFLFVLCFHTWRTTAEMNKRSYYNVL